MKIKNHFFFDFIIPHRLIFREGAQENLKEDLKEEKIVTELDREALKREIEKKKSFLEKLPQFAGKKFMGGLETVLSKDKSKVVVLKNGKNFGAITIDIMDTTRDERKQIVFLYGDSEIGFNSPNADELLKKIEMRGREFGLRDYVQKNGFKGFKVAEDVVNDIQGFTLKNKGKTVAFLTTSSWDYTRKGVDIREPYTVYLVSSYRHVEENDRSYSNATLKNPKGLASLNDVVRYMDYVKTEFAV